MNTFMARAADISRKWYIVDAAGKPLGRVATQVATVLRGKHKPEYTPHVDTGDHVIVINCDKVVLTGRKLDQKFYYHHSGYPGGLRKTSYRDMMARKPLFIMRKAVQGMLPKNRLGRQMIKKLRLYAGSEHKHEAQTPEVLDL
ncbi:MAG: 50S ribosomal protein L13 [Clostridiales bacterium]|nr:50S ribosomal protein L13 [Clostridiales bacterium]